MKSMEKALDNVLKSLDRQKKHLEEVEIQIKKMEELLDIAGDKNA